MATYNYEYNTAVEVDAIKCPDGDVILSIKNFPLSTTLYLGAEQARELALQIMEAASETVEVV
jgi:hypothetical protein